MIVVDKISDSERASWLQLFMTENVGPATFFQLLGRHGTASKALSALPDYARRGGRKKPLIIPKIDDINKQIEHCVATGSKIITYTERQFPQILRDIADCPPILFVKGQIDLLSKKSVAIVGTRRASLNNINYTRVLAADIGNAGYPVISGLALGIDGAAHEGSLATGTIAVLAGGLDYIYPPKHTKLFHEIGEKGLLLSERPFESMVYAHDFPRRNRIVSGLSSAVIVIEATEQSGSLITARLAKSQDRIIFAVPGSPNDPRSSGTNALIKQGAYLLTSADDVIKILEQQKTEAMLSETNSHNQFDPWQQMQSVNDTDVDAIRDDVLSMLDSSPIAVDQLIRELSLPPHLVNIVLLELQLAGRLQRHIGNKVSLIIN